MALRATFFSIFFLLSLSAFAQRDSFVMSQVVPNNFLNRPWDLHYGPDDYLWVTERENGRISRINPETGAQDLLATIPGVYADSRQDGLLGMALHDDFMGDNPYVYLSYTYRPAVVRYQRIVRYTYSETGSDGSLQEPVILIDSLPSSNDHNSGRLIFGPDQKLYYTIGDQGGNQNRNYCNPILSQILPTQEEVDQRHWANYPGKVLRINPDGSIPDDNPMLNDVRSHIFSYGHRNPQGLLFGSNGLIYSDEHGPDTDDEVNLITAGMNYGWPRIVGFQDDQAYDFCDWSSLNDCSSFDYDKFSCPDGATLLEENTLLDMNYREPIFSMFAVTDDYDYNDPKCDNSWVCRPNVAPSSLGIYESDAIPAWTNSLLVTSLKRGRVFLLKLEEAGTSITGDTVQLFYTQNRYRDIAVSPDGKSFFVITDDQGNTSDASGLNRRTSLQNPGTILKFTLDDGTTNVDDLTATTPFRLWPNPVTDQLYVEVEATQTGMLRGELINAKGQLVGQSLSLTAGVNRVTVGDLPAGVYTLRVLTEGKYWSKRVVVR